MCFKCYNLACFLLFFVVFQRTGFLSIVCDHVMTELFYKIIAIVLPVLSVIVCGYVYGRLRPVKARAQMAELNPLVMDFFTPMMFLGALSQKDFDIYANGALLMAGFVVVTGGALLGYGVARLSGVDVKTLVPTLIYNNCGNMGLPLAILAFGATGFAPAAVLFVMCNLLYFSVGVLILTGGHLSVKPFNTPIIWAIAASLTIALLRIPVHPVLQQTFLFFTQAAITLMMFSLGVRLLDIDWKEFKIGVLGGVLCPAGSLLFAFGLQRFNVLGLNPEQMAQVYLFASLPPAVSCFMMADYYKQEPSKVAAIVLIGNVLSVVFVPIGLVLAFNSQ